MKHSFNCLSYELLLYVLICIPFCSCSQKDTGVISPNGKICLSVEIKEDTEKDGFGKVFFNVEYKDIETRSHTDGFQRNNAKCLDEKGISRFVPHSSI